MPLAVENRAIEVQAEAFLGRTQKRHKPLRQRPEKRLHPALRKACKKAQHRITPRKASEAQERVKCLIKAQPITVSKARSPQHHGEHKSAKRIHQRDRIGRRIRKRHPRAHPLVKPNAPQPSDETDHAGERSDEFWSGGKFDLARARKRSKIYVNVLCGRRSVECLHKLPYHRPRRAKRLYSIAAFGLISKHSDFHGDIRAQSFKAFKGI